MTGLMIGVVCMALGAGAASAEPIDARFTYQGLLKSGGQAVSGVVDVQASLWDAESGGAQVGVAIERIGVDVSGGLFSVVLDFGPAVFDGDQRWIQLAVRQPSGAGPYQTLAPRQAINPHPYAAQTRGLHVDDAERVGVGTTMPAAQLDVQATDGLPVQFVRDQSTPPLFPPDVLTLTATTPGVPEYGFGGALTWRLKNLNGGQTNAGTIDVSWGLPDGATFSESQMVFRTRSANQLRERMRIDDMGDVGINRTNPAARLHVVGDAGARTALVEALNEQPDAPVTALSLRATPADYAVPREAGFGVGLDWLLTTNGVGAQAPAGRIEVEWVDPDVAVRHADMVFRTLDNNFNAPPEQMRIRWNGTVGIGTSVPTAQLHVIGTGSSGMGFRVNDRFMVNDAQDFVGVNRSTPVNATEAFGITSTAGTDEYGGMYVTASGALGKPYYGYRAGTDNKAFHYYDSIRDLFALNVSGERMVVTAGGDIGINDSTPDARLDVVAGGGDGLEVSASGIGDASVRVNATSNAAGVVIEQSGQTDQVPALAIDADGSAVQAMTVNVDGGISNLARFTLNNSTSISPAFVVEADTLSNAAYVDATNNSGNSAAMVVRNTGSGIEAHGLLALQTDDGDQAAVLGDNDDTDGAGIGVRGRAGWRGVYGQAVGSGTGSRYGVYGVASATGTTNHGVYGTAFNGSTNWAGYFSGSVNVTGSISKGGGSFRIDHPLDPENKYLYHSFVESPDMMNIYNGNVTLDGHGEAEVVLPEWFESLNREFRYQLTAIGAPGPNLYVAEEITGNRFVIGGGEPGGRVSWQVTGVRHDPYAEAHRIPVEEEKPAHERGYYLHPEAWGEPIGKSVEFASDPKLATRTAEGDSDDE